MNQLNLSFFIFIIPLEMHDINHTFRIVCESFITFRIFQLFVIQSLCCWNETCCTYKFSIFTCLNKKTNGNALHIFLCFLYRFHIVCPFSLIHIPIFSNCISREGLKYTQAFAYLLQFSSACLWQSYSDSPDEF